MLEVKGKGACKTWWLTAKAAEHPRNQPGSSMALFRGAKVEGEGEVEPARSQASGTSAPWSSGMALMRPAIKSSSSRGLAPRVAGRTDSDGGGREASGEGGRGGSGGGRDGGRGERGRGGQGYSLCCGCGPSTAIETETVSRSPSISRVHFHQSSKGRGGEGRVPSGFTAGGARAQLVPAPPSSPEESDFGEGSVTPGPATAQLPTLGG